MSFRSYIEELYRKNTNYAEPEQAINQAESLKSLSNDLYTDSKRFIYELLQNADDSALPGETVKVSIQLFNNHLVIAHSGKPFDERDLRAVCAVNDGTKKKQIEKTGFKGIGFKAVFGQSNFVAVYSEGEIFRFDAAHNFGWKANWEGDQKGWETRNDREFSYPWQIIPIYTLVHEIDPSILTYLEGKVWRVATIIRLNNIEETKAAILDLSNQVNMFLFLKNIELIQFNIDAPLTIKLPIDKKTGRKAIKVNEAIQASWLLRNVILEVPPELKSELLKEITLPDKLKNATEIEISFAAKLGKDGLEPLGSEESLLYAYLPTDVKRYNFPILVNATFLTTANRENLHIDSPWNQWLFNCIALELYKWVGELVIGEYEFQAYRIIPEKLGFSDPLCNAYHEGIHLAHNSVPFILNTSRKLLKLGEAIVDFTFLSHKPFIGGDTIRTFILNNSGGGHCIHSEPFVANSGLGSTLKRIGVTSFEWKDFPAFLNSPIYLKKLTPANNIDLIAYLKSQSESELNKEVSEDKLKMWPFLLTHKSMLEKPSQVYFPTANDQDWNRPDTEVQFLHPELQEWLQRNQSFRQWLEQLGVNEKTDLTFLQKTILANPETYSNHSNAIPTIRNIFNLYSKSEIETEILGQLRQLKLLTTRNALRPASECYLADLFNPRLPLEEVLQEDIFVSESYYSEAADKEEWKRFFKMMGVNDGINIIGSEAKVYDIELVQAYNLQYEYFDAKDKSFSPYINTFKADQYANIRSLLFIEKTVSNNFAQLFWGDVIKNIPTEKITSPAIAYWGNSGMAGRIQGDKVANYIVWFIKNAPCIPTTVGISMSADEVFINNEELKTLLGNYLPVFTGPQLPSEWLSFFKFKSSLNLEDYLLLLTNITADKAENGKFKQENKSRLKIIFTALLQQCGDWGTEQERSVTAWATTAILPDTDMELFNCSDLNYYLDGNPVVFQGEFRFVYVDSENKKHANLEHLLSILQVRVLRQSEFEVDMTDQRLASTLITRLKSILPYLEEWMKKSDPEEAAEKVNNIRKKQESLEIYEVNTLEIKYNNWNKIIHVHLDKKQLFVTAPWNSNKVFLDLAEKLSSYLGIKGFSKQLDFLLRAEGNEEIREYFIEEKIELPAGAPDILPIPHSDIYESQSADINENTILSLGVGSSQELNQLLQNQDFARFFHISTPTEEMFLAAMHKIVRAKTNIIAYLRTLPEYDCTDCEEVAPSIFAGVKKNTQDIYIITRPSDNGEVIIYYPAELDTLELTDAELWYEAGVSTPEKLTLGKILRSTGINRVPV